MNINLLSRADPLEIIGEPFSDIVALFEKDETAWFVLKYDDYTDFNRPRDYNSVMLEIDNMYVVKYHFNGLTYDGKVAMQNKDKINE